LAEIRLAVPEIFDAQSNKMKKSQTALKTEPYLRAVMNMTMTMMVK